MKATTKKEFEKLRREPITVVPYDASWPEHYEELEHALKRILPRRLVQRIAHIGSTAVPGLSAKPIIDVQVEVCDMDEVVNDVAPIMVDAGYQFIWRRSIGEKDPYYAWFIRRNATGERTEHIHVVSPDQGECGSHRVPDHLRHYPEEASAYDELKAQLVKKYAKDRDAYTRGKSEFIDRVLQDARHQRIRK
ncbi:MAG: GrpB family protein [Flavobacteriales bacterium]|nr:GrpB family protein [Flavobacteriales bacterium]